MMSFRSAGFFPSDGSSTRSPVRLGFRVQGVVFRVYCVLCIVYCVVIIV